MSMGSMTACEPRAKRMGLRPHVVVVRVADRLVWLGRSHRPNPRFARDGEIQSGERQPLSIITGKERSMNITQTQVDEGFLQRNRMWLIVVLLIIGLIGWYLYDRRYPSWDEEVQLSDGRVITIHQEHEYYADYGTNQSWVTIDLPELGGKRVWHSYLMPQRVDIVNGEVFVFGIPRGARQLEYYRFPKHYMVAFRWSGSAFERIPFLQVPDSIRKEENIFSCVPTPRPTILTLKSKDSTWCPARGEKGELGKVLNLSIYTDVADQWAATYNWTNRSE